MCWCTKSAIISAYPTKTWRRSRPPRLPATCGALHKGVMVGLDCPQGRIWSDVRAAEERSVLVDGSCSSGIAGGLSGAGAQRGFSAAELLSPLGLVLAGRDQGGVSRPREHRLAIRHAVRSPCFRCGCPRSSRSRAYVKPSRFPAFTRFNVFLRDRFTCQYCGEREDLTFDHVVPRSKGGVTTWENVVAACSACNLRKADMLPADARMWPAREPYQPSVHDLHQNGRLFPPNYLHRAGWTIFTGIANWSRRRQRRSRELFGGLPTAGPAGGLQCHIPVIPRAAA